MATNISEALTVVLTLIKAILGPGEWARYRRTCDRLIYGSVGFAAATTTLEHVLGHHPAACLLHNDLVTWTTVYPSQVGYIRPPYLQLPKVSMECHYDPSILDQYLAVSENMGLFNDWLNDETHLMDIRSELRGKLAADRRQERDVDNLSDLFKGIDIGADERQAQIVENLSGLFMSMGIAGADPEKVDNLVERVRNSGM